LKKRKPILKRKGDRATKPVVPVRSDTPHRPISKSTRQPHTQKPAIKPVAKPPYKTNAYKQAHDYTAASRVQRAYAKASDLDFEMPDSKLIKKREKYRFNLRLFCDEVLTPWFPLPHSEDQLFCLNELQTIAIEGGSRAIARSRGTGKSQHTRVQHYGLPCFGIGGTQSRSLPPQSSLKRISTA